MSDRESINKEFDSMVFYRSFLAILDPIEDKEKRLKLYETIVEYGLSGNLPKDLTPMEMTIMTHITPTINKCRNRYNNKVNYNEKVKQEREKQAKKKVEETMRNVKTFDRFANGK